MSTISTRSGKNAYLVVWTTGECEERIARNLGVFLNDADARAYASAVNAELKAMGLHANETAGRISGRVYHYGDLHVDDTGAEVYVDPVIIAPEFAFVSQRVKP